MNWIGWIRNRGGTLLAIATIILVVDQVTKYAATTYLGPGGQVEKLDVIGSWLRFDYVTNSGAAFGVLQDRTLLFSIIALAAIPVLLFFYNSLPITSTFPRACIGLLLGGTLGNLADRMRFGYVVDFIDAGYGHLRWPTFNVADSAFVVGVFVLAGYLIMTTDKANRQSAVSER